MRRYTGADLVSRQPKAARQLKIRALLSREAEGLARRSPATPARAAEAGELAGANSDRTPRATWKMRSDDRPRKVLSGEPFLVPASQLSDCQTRPGARTPDSREPATADAHRRVPGPCRAADRSDRPAGRASDDRLPHRGRGRRRDTEHEGARRAGHRGDGGVR